MRPRRRVAACGVACAALLAAAPASACILVLAEHRSGLELARLPLDPAAPALRIEFTHSVLGTPVQDRYVFRPAPGAWQAVLVEERWQGHGYGLPHDAGPGERIERDPGFGADGWRLSLQRVVHPFVVRPLPAQRMRVLVHGRAPLLLGTLSARAVHLHVEQCPPAPKDPA